jgi:hypothetical protein
MRPRTDKMTSEEVLDIAQFLDSIPAKLNHFLDYVRQRRIDKRSEFFNCALWSRYDELEQLVVLAARLAPYIERLSYDKTNVYADMHFKAKPSTYKDHD